MTSSYFSAPDAGLDPDLFDGDRLKEGVRLDVLSRLIHFLHVKRFHSVESWIEVWLAGSGVSYQWAAHRDPGDLDCLIGIHFETFRQTNPQWAGLGNAEIAAEFNELLWTSLVPTTTEFMGKYELTYYVNDDSTDIKNINPYAAYDLRHNQWTVHPDKASMAVTRVAEWELQADRDNKRAQDIVARYTKFMAILGESGNPAVRSNAEIFMSLALSQAKDLYSEIHVGRKASFARTGKGYTGQGNYRWQAGKERGTVQALKTLTEYYEKTLSDADHATYGIGLPDTETLIRRSMLWQD